MHCMLTCAMLKDNAGQLLSAAAGAELSELPAAVKVLYTLVQALVTCSVVLIGVLDGTKKR